MSKLLKEVFDRSGKEFQMKPILATKENILEPVDVTDDELKNTQNLEEAFGLKEKLRRLNRAEKSLDKTNTKLKQYIDRRDKIKDMSPAFKDDKLNKKIDKNIIKSQDKTTKIEKKASKLVDTILSNEKAWNKTRGDKMPTSVDTEIDTRNEKAFNKR